MKQHENEVIMCAKNKTIKYCVIGLKFNTKEKCAI